MIGYLIYAVIGVVFGYVCARWVWTDDGYRPPSQIQPHSLPASLLVWVLAGMLWPLLVVIYVIGMLVDWCGTHPGERIGKRLFGD